MVLVDKARFALACLTLVFGKSGSREKTTLVAQDELLRELRETLDQAKALIKLGEIGAALHGLDLGIQQLPERSSPNDVEFEARELFWETVKGGKEHVTQKQITRSLEHAEWLLEKGKGWEMRRDLAEALASEGRIDESRAHLELLLQELEPTISDPTADALQIGTYADTTMKLSPWDQGRVRAAIHLFERCEKLLASAGKKSIADTMKGFRLTAQRHDMIVSELRNVREKIPPRFTEISIYDASLISFETFFNEFAIRRLPVLLRNGTHMMFQNGSKPWNMRHIKHVCRGKGVGLFSRVSGAQGGSVGVGQQVLREVATLDDWVSRMKSLAAMSANEQSQHEDSKLYVSDQSIPNVCPALLANFQIPHFFAQDYTHRARGEQHSSWPSMFLGPAGTGTDLHKDAYDTNFWMGQLRGRKQWTFFSAESSVAADVALHWNEYNRRFDVEDDGNSLTSLLQPVTITSHPGDLIFIPQGMPHSVENLDIVLAVSVNYIDLSNFWAAQQNIRTESLRDKRLQTVADAFRKLSFDWRMDREPTHAAYGIDGKQLRDQARRKRSKDREAPRKASYLPIGLDDKRLFRKEWRNGISRAHNEL